MRMQFIIPKWIPFEAKFYFGLRPCMRTIAVLVVRVLKGIQRFRVLWESIFLIGRFIFFGETTLF